MYSRQMGHTRDPSMIFLPLERSNTHQHKRILISLNVNKTNERCLNCCGYITYQSMQVDIWPQLSITQFKDASKQTLQRFSSSVVRGLPPPLASDPVEDAFCCCWWCSCCSCCCFRCSCCSLCFLAASCSLKTRTCSALVLIMSFCS